MNLHEYQGKQLFAEYGLPESKGYAVDTPKEAAEAADKIGGDEWVVKAQVHAGGRGKAGGVKLVKTKEEIKEFAQHWLGKNLVTYQTDEGGQPVSKILVETCTDIAEALYLGAVVDHIDTILPRKGRMQPVVVFGTVDAAIVVDDAAIGMVKLPTFERKELLILDLRSVRLRVEFADGVEFKLSDYQGKVIFLDFWGDW